MKREPLGCSCINSKNFCRWSLNAVVGFEGVFPLTAIDVGIRKILTQVGFQNPIACVYKVGRLATVSEFVGEKLFYHLVLYIKFAYIAFLHNILIY